MDAIGVGDFSSGYDIGNIQIGQVARRRTNAYRFIRKTEMKAFPVGGRIDSNRFDSHLFTGTDNSQRNFAPVGYQYFFEHDLYYFTKWNMSGWFYKK
jgi:hypothetical protein